MIHGATLCLVLSFSKPQQGTEASLFFPQSTAMPLQHLASSISGLGLWRQRWKSCALRCFCVARFAIIMFILFSLRSQALNLFCFPQEYSNASATLAPCRTDKGAGGQREGCGPVLLPGHLPVSIGGGKLGCRRLPHQQPSSVAIPATGKRPVSPAGSKRFFNAADGGDPTAFIIVYTGFWASANIRW